MNRQNSINCEGVYNTPLLDIATDKKSLWWCYVDCLVKTDMVGKLLATQTLSKTGTCGIAIKENKLYRLTAREDSSAAIDIYDTNELRQISALTLPQTISPLAITSDGTHFFIVVKAANRDTKISVHEYDSEFNFIKLHQLYTNSPVDHIRNIIFCNNHFYLARYSTIKLHGEIQNYTLLKYDQQFSHQGSFNTYCGAGAVELTDSSILVGRTRLKEYSDKANLNSLYAARYVRDQQANSIPVKDETIKTEKWIGIARTAEISDMGLDVIGPQRLKPVPFVQTPQHYFETRSKCNVERNRLPYANIKWDQTEYVLTTSHMHCRSQQTLDRAFERGLRFLTISNYYPAAPLYPIVQNSFIEDWAGATDGLKTELKGKPQNLVELIMDEESGWQGELEPEVQRDLFTKQQLKYDFVIPNGVIEAPNAEHYDFTVGIDMHITTPGSTFSSGHFDSSGKYRFNYHGVSIGLGMAWPLVFDKIFNQLIFEDGGGIIINHPMSWGPDHPGLDAILSLLDFDSRVMGIEIINTGDDWSENLWDSILATGRQCFGFFVPDHDVEKKSDWVGVNVLLARELTAHECLKAYRQGEFYGALYGNSIRFLAIHTEHNRVTVETDNAECIEFITEKGVVLTINSNSGSYQLPLNSQGKPDLIYLRVRAYEYADNKNYAKCKKDITGYIGNGEVIFSQAIMF